EHPVPETEVAGVAPQQVEPGGEDGPDEELAGVERALPGGHDEIGEDVEGNAEEHQRMPDETPQRHSNTPSTPKRPRGRTSSSPRLVRLRSSQTAPTTTAVAPTTKRR